MKFIKFCLLFSIFVDFLLASDFISSEEYAKMLYQNPRGISCSKCHGAKGQGTIIAKYKIFDKSTNKFKTKLLEAPKLNDIDFNDFRSALIKSKGIMPPYFLTENEIKSLFDYVKTFEKKDKE